MADTTGSNDTTDAKLEWLRDLREQALHAYARLDRGLARYEG
jgi:hypothetical protein